MSSRGGTPVEDGFYALPVSPTRRRTEQIPKRKASLYRKRYALLGRAADDEIVPQTRTIYQDPLEAGEDLMSLTIDSSVSVKRWDADVGAYPK